MAISKTILALLLAWTATAVFATAQSRSAPHPHLPTAEEHAADDLKDAEDLLQKQQYQQAEEKLLALAPKQSGNPQVWFDLGFVQSQLGKFPEAIKAYKKATELNPQWFQAQQNLGAVMAKSGDFRGAATVFKIAVTLKPEMGDKAEVSDNQALSLSWMSLAFATAEFDPQEAWLDAAKAAQLAPVNESQMIELADKIAVKDEEQGEKAYQELANAGDQQAMVRLTALYLRQKRYADAETWLRKYTAANPSNTDAKVQLGKVLAAEGKTQEAAALLEAAYDAA